MPRSADSAFGAARGPAGGVRPAPSPATAGSPAAVAVVPPADGGRRWLSSRGWGTILIFLTPALLLFGLLVIAPIALAAYTSLLDWNGFRGTEEFIGLENFRRLLEDEVFVGDLRRGLILIVLSVTVQLPLALGLALLLNQPIRGRAVYRVMFFAPYVLAEVITAVLFQMVLSPNAGLANQVLSGIGLGGLAEEWLSNTSTVLYAVFVVITWKYFGFYMILFLAARQSIPAEIIEAAAVDGATGWNTFRHVTLPLLGPTIRIAVFLSIIGTIQLFDAVWVLTEGGPVNASETMAITMYRYGFESFEVGYASAISIAMFLISLVFALLYQRFVLRRDMEGAVTVIGGKR
ncbi:carbohydrate ABC transporter membrane protein 1, CUT1 family [Micromonospora pattaloongensis]|uniref:Carbohydrate ABC transporter membrane protein 1, CUT1 family n=1 Tax=Micromonospora pattaloongensis TaxID=405436 RepID=A0A1H3JER5_9ACTN|nr:sugar ABC transporter permease [Micromonospora pattaloongensis]SDY38402.1 carbohydrate ABC transporter membrane protein 1, CUT1 family [Micromonospora pattaloongensis]